MMAEEKKESKTKIKKESEYKTIQYIVKKCHFKNVLKTNKEHVVFLGYYTL